MSLLFDQISPTPAAAVLGVAGVAATTWALVRRRAWTVPRALVGLAICVYAVGILVNSAFPIYLGAVPDSSPWTTAINYRLFHETELDDAVENILIFAPVGVLLPLALRIRTVVGVIVGGFLLSLTIELLQLLNSVTGHGGHIADVNDLLANTIGAPVGYAVARLAMRLPPLRALAATFAWPGAGFSAEDRERRPAEPPSATAA
ncbi:VanZ family protein [Patulibacter sp. SYSU D01012]|uniref:VanZ family protein n=1 Tax=Patulibacter sp. SYSU D01012 TaxID=2817381 RepID=UPI001B313478|nr:VanZ family protein [Patulibacter sp. SYSU D01012]